MDKLPEGKEQACCASFAGSFSRRDLLKSGFLASGAALLSPVQSAGTTACGLQLEQRRLLSCEVNHIPIQFEEVGNLFLVRMAGFSDGQTTIHYSETFGLLLIRRGNATAQMVEGRVMVRGGPSQQEPVSVFDPSRYASQVARALREMGPRAVAAGLSQLTNAVDQARVSILQQGFPTFQPSTPHVPDVLEYMACLEECARRLRDCQKAADDRANQCMRDCEAAHPPGPVRSACVTVCAERRLQEISQCEEEHAKCLQQCAERFPVVMG